MKTYLEPAREVKVRAEVDILVVGGGPAGIMAAEAGAKGGKAKVMLLGQRGFLWAETLRLVCQSYQCLTRMATRLSRVLRESL